MKYILFSILAILMIGYFSNYMSYIFIDKQIKSEVLSANPGSVFKGEGNLLIPFYVDFSYKWESKSALFISSGKGHNKRIWLFGLSVLNIRSGSSISNQSVTGN